MSNSSEDSDYIEISSDSDDYIFTNQYYPTYTPLMHTWVLCYLNPNDGWNEGNEILNIKSVEEFWSVYSNIKLPCDLFLGSSYRMFKNGVYPDWNSEENKNGGRWIVRTNKPRTWLSCLLIAIGGQFDILGVICDIKNNREKSTRKKIKLITMVSLWIPDLDEEQCLEIGKYMREYIDKEVFYIKHSDCTNPPRRIIDAKKTYVL